MNKILLFTAFLFFSVISCTDVDDNQPPNEVWMTNTAFLPTELVVAAGTTVVWVNTSDVIHTVTSTDGLFDEVIGVDESFSFTFEETGTFTYTCKIHTGMAGSIIVE